MTRQPTDRAAVTEARTPAGQSAAQGRRRTAKPPGMAAARPSSPPAPVSSPLPTAGPEGTLSPSLLSVTAPSAAARGPSSSQQSRERTGARTPAPDTGTADPAYLPAVPVRVRATAPGSALPASRAEPGQVPGSAPDASALPAGSGQGWQQRRGALTVSAHCGCGWTEGPGDWAAVDRAADKHAKRPGHAATVIAEAAGGSG